MKSLGGRIHGAAASSHLCLLMGGEESRLREVEWTPGSSGAVLDEAYFGNKRLILAVPPHRAVAMQRQPARKLSDNATLLLSELAS